MPVTTVVSGGGDGTLISAIFSLLDPQSDETNGKCNSTNSCVLVQHSCLLLATVAQCLKFSGRNSALFMLTTSPKKQLSRLSLLAHNFPSDNKAGTSSTHSYASAMVAFASILFLESGSSVESPVSEIAAPLIPCSSILCEYLKISLASENGGETISSLDSYWHGFKDGCVGLLESTLKWGGRSSVQQLCTSGVHFLFINLLSKNSMNASSHNTSAKDGVGLSPVGVLWMLSAMYYCLSGGSLTFRQILVSNEHVKLIAELICDVHLKLVNHWNGPGGGKDGVRDLINLVIDLLAFPFVALQSAPGMPSATASVNSGFLLNMGIYGGRVCIEDRGTLKTIEDDMDKYIKILLEVSFLPAPLTFFL